MGVMKKLVKRIADGNYHTAKAVWKMDQRRNLSSYCGQPIINYQMGKVGSSTVQASLDAVKIDHPIYHVHFLNPVRVREIELQRKHYFRTDRYNYLRRSWLSEFLYEEIQKKNRHWKMVSLVREPIARNISTFFENLEVETVPADPQRYSVKSEYYGFDTEISVDNTAPLIELFFERLMHDRPLRYFDDEVKTVLGIDIFASEFPRQKGYQILKEAHVDSLVIRLDDLDQCAEPAFKEFLAIDDFRLQTTNVGGDKIYAPLYREFKRRIRVPRSYIEQMYASKFARHFYSPEELEQLAGKWSGTG